ncbi:serine/threonine-protein kinase [Nocardia brasiliensis]|uniref:serine/threonine-protein kinase n=1 Tax=Nocardia brasiliensis TaxID=37326 RepID=UPI0018947242|nr:serine/threonine-protein kinase [Nocardia brasiliensis]MBF6125408.1 protein kinase [Nocardia brasiliensis]
MGATWFGHYRLDRLLGSGGTGQVWLAHDDTTGRSVALKVLSTTYAAEPAYRQRFTREARLAAQVRGPHLASIHAFGEHDGRLYLAMEFIAGVDLAALLQQEGPLPPARAVRIVMQVAQALDDVHRAGLVHRDVKPSNIMLGPDDHVHLIDFGTAYRIDQPALTTSSHVVGTLAYMAPERFSGAGDARSDQYSLACVLYECLTARRPFGNADAAQSLLAHLMTEPPLAADWNPAVPAALDAVIARGMAKVPEQRCANAGELAAAAYAAVTGLDVPTVETAAVVLPATTVAGQPFRTSESAATRPSTRPERMAGAQAAAAPQPSPARREANSRIAAAVLVGLLVTVGLVPWLGQSLDREKGSAARASAPLTPSGVVSSPVETVPTPVPAVSVPAAWQPCDPAVAARGVGADGVLLRCVPTVGSAASWMPSEPSAEPPRAEPPKPDTAKPGRGGPAGVEDDNNGKSEHGGSGHDNGNGHGRGKPGKDK